MSGWRRERCRITASPDLNTLFPASAKLFATMANKINERGQISGRAIPLSGPDAGNIHAFLATPVNGSIGISVADVAPTRPNISLPRMLPNNLCADSYSVDSGNNGNSFAQGGHLCPPCFLMRSETAPRSAEHMC